MNCRSLAAALLVTVILVHTVQAAKLRTSTSWHAKAAATILPAFTNGDIAALNKSVAMRATPSAPSRIVKYILPDGHVTNGVDASPHKIIIVDLP